MYFALFDTVVLLLLFLKVLCLPNQIKKKITFRNPRIPTFLKFFKIFLSFLFSCVVVFMYGTVSGIHRTTVNRTKNNTLLKFKDSYS